MMPKAVVVGVLIGLLLIAGALINVFIYDGHLFLKRPSGPVSSAISLAVEMGEVSKARREAEKELGIERSPFVSDENYLFFMEKALFNIPVRNAIKHAKKSEVIVVVGSMFRVNSGIVEIDASAPDGKIIEFLLGTPAETPTGR